MKLLQIVTTFKISPLCFCTFAKALKVRHLTTSMYHQLKSLKYLFANYLLFSANFWLGVYIYTPPGFDHGEVVERALTK